MDRTPDQDTLMRAEHFLRRAATPHADTAVLLQELMDLLEALDRKGPSNDLIQRAAGVVSRLRNDARLLCDIRVAIEGRDVVIRIGCVPE